MLTSAWSTYKRSLPLAVAVSLTLVGCEGEQAKPEPEPKPAPAPKVQPAPAPKPAPDPTAGLPKTPANLAEARVQLRKIYPEGSTTLLCGCQFGTEKVSRASCGYQARADEELAGRLTWEHIVPVRDFGKDRACWKTAMCKDDAGKPYRGVKCCREVDPVFHTMETDMHNLAPMVSELANDRAGVRFAEIEREQRMYGMCNVEIDQESEVIEPRDEVRGDIARAYLYMRQVYGDAVLISPEQIELYRAWHEADPPDEAEVQRNAKIAAAQGNANPFIPLPG